MSDVVIRSIWTADPSSIERQKSSFFLNDPFAIVIYIGCSADLVEERQRYDLEWQMVNPREDISGRGWWKYDSGSYDMCSTLDFSVNDQVFPKTNFYHWIWWEKYSDVINGVGAGALPGVFSVRGNIQVIGSDLFDMTRPHGFNYQLRREK